MENVGEEKVREFSPEEQELREWVSTFNEEALLADGFDDAVMGMAYYFGKDPVVAYDRDECIAILAMEFANDPPKEDLDDWEPYEEAMEYFEYNVAGSYVGENTPVFIEPYPKAYIQIES